jgi:cysteinyl-tRNA synthetase
VRYWLHNGFVNINSEKMSKSLGNFFTIREVLKKYDPETLRFFIISAHYRSPIDFSDQNLDEAQSGLERIYSCLKALDDILNGKSQPAEINVIENLSQVGLELQEKVDQFMPRFVEAMDDDFNTAQALGVLFETVRAANRFLAEIKEVTPLSLSLIAHARHLFVEVGGVLGLFVAAPADWLEGIKSAKADQIDMAQDEIERLIAERAEARAAKNFKRGDEIRDLLLAKGIQLLDSAQETTWNVK